MSSGTFPLARWLRQASQILPEEGRIEGVGGRVDFANLALGIAGVRVLYHAADRPRFVAKDPPVAGSVRDVRGEHGDRILAKIVH